MYYSGWYVPFPTGFAKTIANNGAVPLVQMDPDGIASLPSLPGDTMATSAPMRWLSTLTGTQS